MKLAFFKPGEKLILADIPARRKKHVLGSLVTHYVNIAKNGRRYSAFYGPHPVATGTSRKTTAEKAVATLRAERFSVRGDVIAVVYQRGK
jgi:hypothetical protein